MEIKIWLELFFSASIKYQGQIEMCFGQLLKAKLFYFQGQFARPSVMVSSLI